MGSWASSKSLDLSLFIPTVNLTFDDKIKQDEGDLHPVFVCLKVSWSHPFFLLT